MKVNHQVVSLYPQDAIDVYKISIILFSNLSLIRSGILPDLINPICYDILVHC